jgi:hypothetical protein
VAEGVADTLAPSCHSSLFAKKDHLNKHGELFLTTTRIRNFTSKFKDKAFLDFFCARLRQISEDERQKAAKYDFVSPCGPELNWIRAEDTAVVFQDLDADGLFFFLLFC